MNPSSPTPEPHADGEDLASFLHRQIRTQLDILRTHEDGARAGEEAPLHDLRVALRRLRTLLRAFPKNLAGTAAANLEARLSRLLKALGPARDMDIWLLFLNDHPELRRRSVASSHAFLKAQQKEKQAHQRRVAARLDGNAYRKLMTGLERLLEHDLASGSPALSGVPVAEAGRSALRKALKRVRKRARGLPHLSPSDLHRLRIACRRARYLAEFLVGLLPAPLKDLADRLKAVQDVLGTLHDRDVCIARLRAARPPPPPELLKTTLRRRDRDLIRFQKTWDRFRRPGFQRRLRQALGK